MRFRLLFAVAVTALLSLPVYAQVGQGNVRGKVVDREGKPVQGAVVRVEQLSTHQTSEGKTNRNGEFQIGAFPGQYKATLIIDGRAVMVRGDNPGGSFYVAEGVHAIGHIERAAPSWSEVTIRVARSMWPIAWTPS